MWISDFFACHPKVFGSYNCHVKHFLYSPKTSIPFIIKNLDSAIASNDFNVSLTEKIADHSAKPFYI